MGLGTAHWRVDTGSVLPKSMSPQTSTHRPVLIGLSCGEVLMLCLMKLDFPLSPVDTNGGKRRLRARYLPFRGPARVSLLDQEIQGAPQSRGHQARLHVSLEGGRPPSWYFSVGKGHVSQAVSCRRREGAVPPPWKPVGWPQAHRSVRANRFPPTPAAWSSEGAGESLLSEPGAGRPSAPPRGADITCQHLVRGAPASPRRAPPLPWVRGEASQGLVPGADQRLPPLLRSQSGVGLGPGCSSHPQLWGALCSPGCPWEGVECKVKHIQMEGHREPGAEAWAPWGWRRLCLATRVRRGAGMAGEGPGTTRACPDPGDGISQKVSST